MNKVILMGRLTRDPELRYGQGGGSDVAVARYTLAVDRIHKREDGQTTDFISCVTFGKKAEFAEKYLSKGMKIAVTGRIQSGSYTNREGQKVFTTNVVVEMQEFCEKRPSSIESNSNKTSGTADASANTDGFMNIPDGLEGEIPFY